MLRNSAGKHGVSALKCVALIARRVGPASAQAHLSIPTSNLIIYRQYLTIPTGNPPDFIRPTQDHANRELDHYLPNQ